MDWIKLEAEKVNLFIRGGFKSALLFSGFLRLRLLDLRAQVYKRGKCHHGYQNRFDIQPERCSAILQVFI